MKLLGFIIGGVILGYLIGAQIGETTAIEEMGGLSLFFGDAIKEHYAGKGAMIGGIIGAVIGFLSGD